MVGSDCSLSARWYVAAGSAGSDGCWGFCSRHIVVALPFLALSVAAGLAGSDGCWGFCSRHIVVALPFLALFVAALPISVRSVADSEMDLPWDQ